MPLNTLRLNHQPSSHPNDRIVFIKPIPRPPTQKDDYKRAETVLKAIAAQCLPIMKDHYLSVTTLEEYEPNPEFIGRNFNNGELIQLVIKSKSGAWLPLNMIQMVMMHELAHNTHMNHGKGFWQARNLYAGEMHALWSRGYTGEGLWGQGQSLRDMDQVLGGRILRSEELGDLPLCGGTFRSRQKKRKPKDDLTWKEKKEKRIEKKFGKNGEALGENEDVRMMLEINRKGPISGKPRVAQSKRGRELRVAAALARFETNKQEVKDVKAEDDEETASESEYEDVDIGQSDAKDPFGRKMLDKQGHGMVRICQGDEDDTDVKKEMEELANLDNIPETESTNARDRDPVQKKATRAQIVTGPTEKATSRVQRVEEVPPDQIDTGSGAAVSKELPSPASSTTTAQSELHCPICSMMNDPVHLICVACAHVLDIRKDPRHWKCESDICKDSAYMNAGDCGVCGVCGTKKPSDTHQITRSKNDVRLSSYSAHIAYI